MQTNFFAQSFGFLFFLIFFCLRCQQITADTEPTEVLSRKMGDEECIGLSCEHARFGISLTKLDDINMDGYQGKYYLYSSGLFLFTLFHTCDKINIWGIR